MSEDGSPAHVPPECGSPPPCASIGRQDPCARGVRSRGTSALHPPDTIRRTITFRRRMARPTLLPKAGLLLCARSGAIAHRPGPRPRPAAARTGGGSCSGGREPEVCPSETWISSAMYRSGPQNMRRRILPRSVATTLWTRIALGREILRGMGMGIGISSATYRAGPEVMRRRILPRRGGHRSREEDRTREGENPGHAPPKGASPPRCVGPGSEACVDASCPCTAATPHGRRLALGRARTRGIPLPNADHLRSAARPQITPPAGAPASR